MVAEQDNYTVGRRLSFPVQESKGQVERVLQSLGGLREENVRGFTDFVLDGRYSD